MTKPRAPAEKLLPAFIKDAKAKVSAARLGLPKRKVKASTAAEYARRAKRVEDARGKLDLVGVGKNELALWKAALKWRAAEKIREACDEAERIWGLDYQKEADRWKAYEKAVKLVKVALWKKEETEHALKQVEAVPKSEVVRKQAGHKKAPFAKGEVSKLLAAVGDSPLRPAYLAAYFCGARPEEFSEGVRVARVIDRETKRAGLVLTIAKRAKQGDGKGQEQGRVFIADDSVKSPESRAIFAELCQLCKAEGGKMWVQVEPTENQTVGQRLTKATAYFSAKAFPEATGPRPSFYSFRQTFSRNIKAAAAGRHGGDVEAAAVEVAQALGHQSTETARHYGRAARGDSEFGPESKARNPTPVRHYGAGEGPEGRAKHRAKRARERERAMIAAGMAPANPAATPRPKPRI